MAAKTNTPELTAEQARELLRYEPGTGRLFWRERRCDVIPSKHSREKWNKIYAGAEAFTSNNGIGYRQSSFNYRNYLAHRVIWLMQTGEWPAAEIDHINGVRDDNRWINLRAVSRAENNRNHGRSSRNTSGVNGVYWYKQRQKWRAQIKVDGKLMFLGMFDTLEAAAAAREAANDRFGFSKRHGEAT